MRAILTYHSIDPSGSPISVDPEAFARHHAWLTRGGIRVLPLEQVVTLADDTPDAVAVTFDDAFLNTRDPLLRLAADGVPATVFVVSGHVGRTNAWGGREQPGIPTLPLMSWDDLEQLAGRGVTLASHTRSHPPLSTLPLTRRSEELEGSRADIEAHSDRPVDVVCYPYGDLDETVKAEASAWYRYGCTTEFRGLGGDDPALALPRLDMYYFRGDGALEAWGSPAFARRVRWCRLRRALRARLLGGGTPPRVAAATNAPNGGVDG